MKHQTMALSSRDQQALYETRIEFWGAHLDSVEVSLDAHLVSSRAQSFMYCAEDSKGIAEGRLHHNWDAVFAAKFPKDDPQTSAVNIGPLKMSQSAHMTHA